MNNIIIENGILKKMNATPLIYIPNNVKIIGGMKEEKDLNLRLYGYDIFYHNFAYSNKILAIHMSDDVEVIGEKAFLHCHNLEQVKCSKNLKKIGLSSFLYCENLYMINLPKTLEHISCWAFANIKNLHIIYEGSKEDWNKIYKEDEWNKNSKIFIYMCNM